MGGENSKEGEDDMGLLNKLDMEPLENQVNQSMGGDKEPLNAADVSAVISNKSKGGGGET